MRRVVPVAMVATLVMLMLPTVGRQQAAAEGTVQTWVTVSSIAPAAGCTIDLSVELRSGGSPAGWSDVLAALSYGGDLVSADDEVADDSGIANLTLDASAGIGDRIDIMVGNTFLTGFPVNVGAGSSCGDSPALYTASGDVPVGTVDSNSSDGISTSSGSSSWIPTYVQQRNLSCEYAALTIATAAWGNAVSEYAFDDLVGWSANPHWGYRGDINGWWGNTDDYGVYAEALAAALPAVGYQGVAFYGGGSTAQLTNYLDAGVPTLVWLSFRGDQSHYEWTDDGTRFTLVAGEHVVVAYDYDANGIWVSDPAHGSIYQIDWGTFRWMWDVLDGMSLAVMPA
jgi:uncharacterized protein YvpB